jgi:serine/threonine protein kinase/Tol biopolymer transport system component
VVGRTLSRYEVLEKLGEGGMGVVYKARDTRLERSVAVKVLPLEKVADPERKRRFVQEAKAASALNHPNIITIHDIDEADGVHFIAMEYVAGKTLDRLIPRQGLPLNEALRYALEIADALAAAHEAGIVHRDIKPSNVMVTEEGHVKLLDFGLAKLAEPRSQPFATTQTELPRTEEGVVVGTAAYMSPEQAQGKQVDARTDIFSFGSLLYEMITGRPAFHGDNSLAVLSKILNEEPQSLNRLMHSVPGQLERLVSRALRKESKNRWHSMKDVRVLLAEVLEEVESPRVAVSKPRRRWTRAAILGALALVIGGAIWLGFLRPKSEAPGPPQRTVPFTSLPGRELDPAISTDGKQVAFAWDSGTGQNLDIYIKLIGADHPPLRLTTNLADDFGPAWSPDGRQVAFYRRLATGAEILVVPALGGRERRLGLSNASWLADYAVGVNHRLSWSADGKSLAIVDRESPHDPNAIFLLSTETGDKRRLTSPAAGYIGDTFPALSPDGQTLAFARMALQTGDIYLSSVAGDVSKAEPERRTFDERHVRGLTWTPDGNKIIFSSNRQGTTGLWITPAARISEAGIRSRREPAELEQVAAGGENAAYPSVSRVAGGGANHLVYARFETDTNIWRIPGSGSAGRSRNSRGSTGEKVQPTRIISSTRGDYGAQFSPDGKRIVFASDRAGSNEVWVCDSDGLNPIKLTSLGNYSGSPRWSPDGQNIAFDVLKEGHRQIYIVAAEGGSPRLLTTGTFQNARPSWSRDGRWVYFGSNRTGGWQVWKVRSGRGEALQVTRLGGREAFESPKDKFLYYAKEQGVSGIWRVPVEGGEETKVLDQGAQGGFAVTDDGILFVNLGDLNACVVESLSFVTGRVSRITTLPKELATRLATAAPYICVSRDNRWILLTTADRLDSDLRLVENFR